MTYQYKHKCDDGVPETLEATEAVGMYVWDAISIYPMESRATKHISSGKSIRCDGGGGVVRREENEV